MRIIRLDKSYRNLRRYRQIVSILMKYGFAEIFSRAGLATRSKIAGKVFGPSISEEVSYATRLRLALEELGPTFIKLGQVLSTRPFLIPKELAQELSRLQDDVPSAPFIAVKPLIERSLERPIDECFAEFDPVPVAAASIAQVYQALLKTGEPVIVKVQRPGIHQMIDADMDILMDLAHLLERHLPEFRRYDPTGVIEEIAKTTRAEMDFLNEGRSAERFAKNFADTPQVYVPKVYWELTTPSILTLERIDGIKISDTQRIEREGLDRRVLARLGGDMVLKQIFEDGFFHADPHPGNLFVLKGNTIAPVDFGMMGHLDRTLMRQLGGVLLNVLRKDAERIVRSLIAIGALEDGVDVRGFTLDMSTFLDRYADIPMNQIDVRMMVEEVFEIVRRHRIGVQSNLLLLAKALGTYEELARTLDPEFNVLVEARPFVRRLILRWSSPGEVLRDLVSTFEDYRDLTRTFPVELEAILKKLHRGTLWVGVEHRDLDRLVSEIDRASNRLSFSFIIAGLVVGSSLILAFETGPRVFGLPLFGALGFLFAGFLGIWLLIAILRSGKL